MSPLTKKAPFRKTKREAHENLISRRTADERAQDFCDRFVDATDVLNSGAVQVLTRVLAEHVHAAQQRKKRRDARKVARV